MPDSDRVSFLGKPLPPGFELRTVAVEPGDELPYRDDDWRDALVIVERGELDIECVRGGHRQFRSGAILWLTGLPLRMLRNLGSEPVVIAAVSRKPAGPMNSPSHRSLNGKAMTRSVGT
jgi:hypothetical protein